ncbi:hypothetical protein L8O87_10910, partial [Enterobacter kobei]|uniref:hypothetical protein n=1 Tax=Enterobacter kobei TaxID=208224 RepID=UPI002006B11B
NTDDLFVGKTLLHGDVLMWLMKTLLTSGCTNQRGAGQLKLEKTFLFKRDEEYIRPITPLLIMVEDDNENCYLSSSREHLDVWCDKYDISKNYMQLMIME